MTFDDIIAWGQNQQLDRFGCAVDTEGQFSQEDVERLRKLLRHFHLQQIKIVSGSYRQGYEIKLGNVAVGVTNTRGSNKFSAYYRPLRQAGNG